ncbi:CPBP family intramembrane glutamic endopeptidase [Butyrivibrio sp. XPD2006]|uniref:CPBP family intramembrane glutamic endopeptidase n=1 Tax=Butyrivibrio sp. XPD2006 TaxID=1280668 RepID=UPI0003B56C66|nr:CPBP family intramembrane glutamic endopeptidase [Butyrivibrio sp. XPD2006]
MAMTLGELFSAVVQIILFSLIPFIWWLVTARKKESFFSWIGLKKPVGNRRNILIWIVCVFVICEAAGFLLYNLFMKADWNQQGYAGVGAAGIPAAIIFSYIHTAFSEEILFRGFLQKRLQKQFGFAVGTFIQSFVFGAIHVVLNLSNINLVQGIVLMVVPMIIAVFLAIINEKKCGGSIIPGWLIHGTMNLITNLSTL